MCCLFRESPDRTVWSVKKGRKWERQCAGEEWAREGHMGLRTDIIMGVGDDMNEVFGERIPPKLQKDVLAVEVIFLAFIQVDWFHAAFSPPRSIKNKQERIE